MSELAAVRREEVGFDSGGEGCAGWLHLPPGAGPHPCAVMLHSTAGVRQLRCYAERGDRLAAAGVAALNFDLTCFGASEGEPRQLLDVRRLAADLDAALAFVRGRPDVDAERIGVWTASASCGPALARAARPAARGDDAPGIRAVVCLTPFVPGRATQRSARTPVPRLAAAAIADRMRMALGREPRGVKVGGEEGETAILVREDAAAGERSLLPADARLEADGQRAVLGDGEPRGAGRGGPVVWENRVVLRPRLRTPNPLRLAPRVEAPLLVVAGERDELCPPGPAAALAERAPNATLELLDTGHFDLYRGAALDAEARFLAAHLGAIA